MKKGLFFYCLHLHKLYKQRSEIGKGNFGEISLIH